MLLAMTVASKFKSRQKLLARFRVHVLFGLLAGLFSVNLTSPAFAELPWVSSTDYNNQSGILPQYDVKYISAKTFTEKPGEIYFFMHLNTNVPANIFNVPGKSPWAMIGIWYSKPSSVGGNTENFRIYVPTNFRQDLKLGRYSSSIEAGVPDSTGSLKQSFKNCSPEVYADPGVQQWIGFVINKACAGIPDVFWISSYITENNGGPTWDYAPDTAEFVSITGSVPVPTPTPTPTKSIQRVQEIKWDSLKDTFPLSEGSIEFSIYATSGLPIVGESLDSTVCDVYVLDDIASVVFNSAGECQLSFTQEGDSDWLADQQYATFNITAKSKSSKPTVKSTPSKKPSVSGSASSSSKSKSTGSPSQVSGKITGGVNSKKITIICVKGSSVKKVTDVKPNCPAGYTKK